MILVRFSTVINDISVQVEGEADTLTGIIEAWESFILSTYQIERDARPKDVHELDIHAKSLCSPIKEVN